MNGAQLYGAMARYNRWMNEKLLLESAKFSDEERKMARGVPFESLHGLWNHVLLANRVWLGRFQESPYTAMSLHDQISADFGELRAEFARTDAQIETFTVSLPEEKLAELLRFVPMSSPNPREIPYWVAVQHFFNHQTHHRGQITALIEQMGGDCGVTDFAAMPEVQLL